MPKYNLVKQMLLSRIEDGTWTVDSPIPSEPEMEREFRVSRTTVRKAIGDLVHAGRLRTVQGSGTFVAARKLPERFVQRAFGIYEDMRRRGLRIDTEILRQEVIAAPSGVASVLGLMAHEKVHVIVRLRSVEGEKILLSTTHIPEALCPDLARDDLRSASLYQVLRERYGLTIARGTRNIESVAAEQWEARLLEVALSTPLLLLESVAYLQDGRPFEYSRALHRGDRARLEVEFHPETDEVAALLEPSGDGRILASSGH